MKRLLIVEHAAGRADGFLTFLNQHTPPVSATVWRCYDSDVPPETEFDGLIIAGGPMMVDQLQAGDHSFFQAEENLIHNSQALGIPILGACLGAQILWTLHGGRVEPGEWVMGWQTVNLVHAGIYDPLFSDVNEKFVTFQLHRDHLLGQAQAVVLATSRTTPVEAFRVPDQPIWGCLFHPEIEVVQAQTVFDTVPTAFAGRSIARTELAPFNDGRVDRHSLLMNFIRRVIEQ